MLQVGRVIQSWWFSLFLIAILPTIWTVWSLINGFVLSGDNAWISLRVFDIFSTNPPLTGMPSTSGLDAPGVAAYHPGPFQFIVMAPFYALSGWSPAAMALISLALYLTLIGISLWAAWRIDIVAAKLAVVGANFIIVMDQQFKMMYPWNMRPVELGMVALVTLMWAIVVGRTGCWPWFIFVSALVAQSHLVGLPAVMISVAVLVLLLWRFGSHKRLARSEFRLTAVIFIVAWALPFWDVLSNSPNNVSEIFAYLTADRETDEEVSPEKFQKWATQLGAYLVAGFFALYRSRKLFNDASPTPVSQRLAGGLAALGLFNLGLAALVWVSGTERLSYLDMVFGAFWMLLIMLVPQPLEWQPTILKLSIVMAVFAFFVVRDQYPPFTDYAEEMREQSELLVSAQDLMAEHKDLPVVVKQLGSYSWFNLYPAMILALETNGHQVHYNPVSSSERYDHQRRIKEVPSEHLVLFIIDVEDDADIPVVEGTLLERKTYNLESSRHPVILTLTQVN